MCCQKQVDKVANIKNNHILEIIHYFVSKTRDTPKPLIFRERTGKKHLLLSFYNTDLLEIS